MFFRLFFAALFMFSAYAVAQDASSIESFTGKVLGDKLRVRACPAVDDTPVVRELSRGEHLLVQGEIDDFYAIKPEAGAKAYVFRTYVLDGVVEGDNVNVRLAPSLEAPIIAQLNRGDVVTGQISEASHRWFEINMPEQVAFYVAKEYIDYAGDASYLQTFQERQDALALSIEKASLKGNAELEKPFDLINFKEIESDFSMLAEVCNSFPDYQESVDTAFDAIRESYIQKKVAFLEDVNVQSSVAILDSKSEMDSGIEAYQEHMQDIEKRLAKLNIIDEITEMELDVTLIADSSPTDKMLLWEPAERELFKSWESDTGKSIEDFYISQKMDSNSLHGILESYDNMVYNKPGDYVLRANGHIVGYVYSTVVDLQGMVGKEVSLVCSDRSNNSFAFPAYFALSVE